MIRYKIVHCRDSLVRENVRWEVWSQNTNDPHEKDQWVGYGSFDMCRAYVVGLIKLQYETKFYLP